MIQVYIFTIIENSRRIINFEMIITTKKFDSTYMCVNKLFIADIRLTIMPLVTEINVGITAHDQSFDRLKQPVL